MMFSMAATDRRKCLFHNIIRLRRAERDAPASRDIVAVRTALEEELGETVSRRLAASLLGVSHTALARWIKAGDLPLVYNTQGRDQVPVATLLDLYERVDSERGSGRRRRHVLEPTMSEGRARANAMNTKDLVSGSSTGPDESAGHRRADLRALAYHRALAPRLRRPMLDDALHRVWMWRDQGKVDERYAQQWEEVLRRPVVEVRRIIGEDAPSARDLRQNSPFAGMLSEAERRKIVDEIR
jgi:hypothetical protein